MNSALSTFVIIAGPINIALMMVNLAIKENIKLKLTIIGAQTVILIAQLTALYITW